MNQLRIGILAEDATDCDALATLVRRMAPAVR
jgi:thiamine biosynthesis lipoprotein ApbE